MLKKDWEKCKFFVVSDFLYKQNQEFFLSFFIKEKKDPKILDLGCSNGSLTLKIGQTLNSTNLYGIELDKKSANVARKKGIKVKISDLNHKFPYPSNFFDVVSANQVLEHLWNTPNFFKEVNRVLKKDGYAVISVPNLSSIHNIFFILLGQQPTTLHLTDVQLGNFLRGTKLSWPSHMKAFTISSLKDLAQVYGFKLEKLKGYGFLFLPPTLNKIFSELFPCYTAFLTMRIRKIKDFNI
ncbi:MAG: class I SAM-dependent methyltransferase [Candidatus Aenigmatarchaeota archaeon]